MTPGRWLNGATVVVILVPRYSNKNIIAILSHNTTSTLEWNPSCQSKQISNFIVITYIPWFLLLVSVPLQHPSLYQGHAAPGLYSAWCAAGLFDKEKLLTLRKIDSDLEGHPTPRLNFIDAATGSLGQGLSVAAGVAYIGKHIEHAR